MDAGAGSFLVEFDIIFDVVIGNTKKELLLLLVVHLGDQQFLNQKGIANIFEIFIPADGQRLAGAGQIAGHASSGTILFLDVSFLIMKVVDDLFS